MIKRYQKLMKKEELDWIVLVQVPNVVEPAIEHLLSVNPGDSILLIPKSGKILAYISPLVKDQIKLPDFVQTNVCKGVTKELKKRTKKDKKDVKIGVSSERLPFRWATGLKKVGKLISIDDELNGVRSIKESYEILNTKRAIEKTEDVLSRCFLRWHQFRTEKDVESFLIEAGSVHGMAFDPIVASGRNSRTPHAVATKSKLNGFCIIDYGLKHKGYRADMTRTVFVGSPTLSHMKIYNMVLKARNDSFAALKPNAKASIVDKVARDIIGERLMHSLGHGVGIDIHEPPFLRPTSKDIIEKNSVFTLEPAYYGTQYGIRIEDMVLMKNKPVYLTTSSNSLTIFPK